MGFIVELEFRLDLRREFEGKLVSRSAAVRKVYCTYAGKANRPSCFRGANYAPESIFQPRVLLNSGQTSMLAERVGTMAIYLQIPNVPGESTDKGYIGQFAVSSLSWGGSNNAVIKPSGDFTTTFTSVSVSKLATISSPTLMLLMAIPKDIGTVVITLASKDSGRISPWGIYTLSNAVVTGFTQSSSGDNPVEDMTFAFSGISYRQITYRNTGSISGDETHSWDLTTGTGS